MFSTKAIPVLILAFCTFALAMPTSPAKERTGTCKSWTATAGSDISQDHKCLSSFLSEFSKNKKKFGKIKQQRYDLPVISSFPVQRILV